MPTCAPIRPPLRGDDDMEQMLPELWKVGGPVGLVVLAYISLMRGWISTRREVDDIRAQRDKADARAEKLLDINAVQTQAISDFARGESLGVYSLEAIKKRADEKSGDA